MSSTKNITGLSRYIMSLPPTRISLLSMIFLSFVIGAVGFLLDPIRGGLLEDIVDGGTSGVIIFGFGSIMAGALTQPWVNSLGGRRMKMKQSMFLAFFSMLIFSIVYLIGCLASTLLGMDLINFIVLASVLIFAFRLLVIWGTSNISFWNSMLIAATQPALIISMDIVVVFLSFPTTNIGYFSIVAFLVKAIIAAAILILAIYSFVLVVESPMRRNLGVGSLEFLSLFLSHITENSPALEGLFEEIGEPIDTIIGVIAFKKGSKLKSLFLSPSVHPGPIGSIGGGNMPTLLAEKFNTFTMVAHGPSTHDFNPVSTKEIEKIERAIRDALDGMEYYRHASRFYRLENGNAKIGVQFFGDSLLLLATMAPHGFDDIDFGVGLSLINLAKSRCNSKNVILVDCHNSFKGEASRVMPGNSEVFDFMDALEGLKCPNDMKDLKVGCASNTLEELSKEDGVGQSGVKVLLVEVDGQKTAYILLDANNMVQGFREEILESVKSLGIQDGEVMTTDTHYVNTLSGGHNPVGKRKKDKIIKAIIECVESAIDDLEPVEVACATARVKSLNTLGPTNSTELVSTISSIVAVSRILAPIIFLVALVFVLVWIFYLNL
ncbi:DUF2070 domain-containing protein [Methanothermobacter tenebrarum]|uniref:DUF2070 domain-containing protein n=2 Tax=Methanothermobacter tenebrarum TaxID=680118 RepID=A0A328PAM2_9EURY|nr:DUF2070 family protein [Methanothermobacter tenebrarum]RAO79848.1 DUF2070 domain-containing protein [Methanothermobacter tenebrarum]